MDTTLSLDSAGDQFWVPNIVRAIGQALVITPVSAITTGGIAPAEAGAASGLSNMLRNLGGAVGTATLSTVIAKREQFHSNIIGQAVTLTRDEVRQRIDDLTSYFLSHGVADLATAQNEAIVAIGRIVRRQALIMGCSDAFAVIGMLFAVAAIAVLFAARAGGMHRAGAH
jgi:MFS transporter, DHA2 family, multidrug resistance protein